MRSVARAAAAALALVALSSCAASPGPLDVAGDYNGVQLQECNCWQSEGRPCLCASPGCKYVEQLSLSTPTIYGVLQATIHATDSRCYSGKMGPLDMDVDRCGAVVAGASWQNASFDANALDQQVDLMIAGNVLGFGGAPASFQHTVIMRQNITICGTREFLEGKCEPGQERLVCFEKFAFCAQGDCASKNKGLLSPSADRFSPPVTSTGLNGTYELVAELSSDLCPTNISVYQFGSSLGLGWSVHGMRMARLSAWLPDEDATHECVNFFTGCNGLQFGFERAHVGNFRRDADGKYTMTVFDVLPVPDSGRLSLSKCVFRGSKVLPPLIDQYANDHAAVIVLSILLALTCFLAAGLLVCCLKYRREYVDTKIARHYDIFQGIGNPGI